MYNIDQLQKMSESQLRDLAKSMGMKKVDSIPNEDLVYQLLDHQAETEAANAPEPGRRRRERIRQPAAKANGNELTKDDAVSSKNKKNNKEQNNTEEKPVSDNKTAEQEQTLPAEEQATVEAPKRKRGRPSAAEKAAREAAKEVAENNEEQPVVKEEPISQDSEKNEPAEKPARRRGRKTKQAVETPVLPFDNIEMQPQEEERPVEELAVDAPADIVEEQQAPAAETSAAEQSPREREAMSLNSFFNTGSGFTFKPRTQQEREEAMRRAEEERKRQAEEAAAAPIVIQEPKVSKENKKNKRKMKQQQQQQIAEVNPYLDQPYNFDGILEAQGVLDIAPEGYGFLRSSDYNYLTSPDDIYVQQSQIKAYGLKTGDVIEGTIRPPMEGEKYFPLSEIKLINGRTPNFVRDRVPFEHLVPLFPDEKFNLVSKTHPTVSQRVVDMFSPIGKGQRGLIVAQPKTGKTMLLKEIANAISENPPETYMIILLID